MDSRGRILYEAENKARGPKLLARRRARMDEEPMEVIHVRVRQRPGGIYLTRDDVPGLFLWGRDPERELVS